MSEVWNRVYESDTSFFGEEPSHFAVLCLDQMKRNNVRKLLELGCGQGRDSVFFASNGVEVEALDYSPVGVGIVNKLAEERKLQIRAQVSDVRKPLPFPDGCFDAVYSHMLLNMRFSEHDLRFIFSEIRRILIPEGFNFFSVRNQNDQFFGKGLRIADGIYDVNGFQVRFYTEQEILDLTQGFEVLLIKEEKEDPVTLYLVICRRQHRYRQDKADGSFSFERLMRPHVVVPVREQMQESSYIRSIDFSSILMGNCCRTSLSSP